MKYKPKCQNKSQIMCNVSKKPFK